MLRACFHHDIDGLSLFFFLFHRPKANQDDFKIKAIYACLQVLAIEFVPLANEFVTLAIEFVQLAIEFVTLAIEFVALARKFVITEAIPI